MFRNYLKIALRNLLKFKGYTAINIAGLAVGMACTLLIFLYVQNELSYDRYHENAERIYRTVVDKTFSGKTMKAASNGAPYGPLLKEAFPEIDDYVRFRQSGKVLVEYQDKKFHEERFFYADASVLNVFTFPLVNGNPNTALESPYSILITETMRKKYFGTENPIGKVLNISNREYTIRGILADIPENSHFKFDLLASFSTLEDIEPGALRHPGNMYYHTYFLLAPGISAAELGQKIPPLLEKSYGEHVRKAVTIFFQPLTRIHLHSHRVGEIEANGSIANVYIFSAIALFILLIACINFMNLATARSMGRAKEVGVRKVLGAYRKQLIYQFLSEALFLSFISLLVGVILVSAVLPLFNDLAEKSIQLSNLINSQFLMALLAIVFFCGIFAGSYPAFFLSGFKPVKVLKGAIEGLSSRSSLLRKGLVTFQFSISIILLTATFIVTDQLNFMMNKPLGFNKEQVAVVAVRGEEAGQQYERIKTEWQNIPGVAGVSAAGGLPGEGVSRIFYFPEQEGSDEGLSMGTIFVDYDYLETLDIPLVSGRNFSPEFSTDEASAFLVNEAAVKKLGWQEPLGKKIVWPTSIVKGQGRIVKEGEVVGVVKDFHYTSLHQPIDPLVLHIRPGAFDMIAVRISPDNIPGTLTQLQSSWATFDSRNPFEYSFLDETFDQQYRGEARFRSIFSYFSTLAIFIACLGLFGLVAFTTTRRMKEIGVRKVLGATMSNIVVMLSKDYAKLVVLASVAAVPLAYYVMNTWLQSFAYRVEMGIWVFFAAGFLTLLIALFTVGYQAVKAARTNPVDALRYE